MDVSGICIGEGLKQWGAIAGIRGIELSAEIDTRKILIWKRYTL